MNWHAPNKLRRRISSHPDRITPASGYFILLVKILFLAKTTFSNRKLHKLLITKLAGWLVNLLPGSNLLVGLLKPFNRVGLIKMFFGLKY